MYEQDFRFSQDIRADLEARSREHRAEREERLSAAREKYRGGISAKREEHQKRHPRSKQARQYGDIEAILVGIGSVGSGGGAIMLILLLVMGMKISDRYTEIQAQKQTLAIMQDTTNGLQLSKCKTQDGQSLVCVAVDSTVQESWGKKGEYRAILPK